MKYRLANLLNAESIATAATKTIDIDSTDVISGIEIIVKGTNASSTPTAHPAKMVSLIEVVDGSDTLFSLAGTECQALNFFEEGKMPFGIDEFENDIQCCASYHLNFGRYLWDEQLGLDPNRFKNLQLKITHNKASGGSAPDAGSMTVFSKEFDEKKANPMGFLQSKKQYTYTLSASAHEVIDLPVDMVLRKLNIASLSASLAPSDNTNKIKLLEDNGKRTPINDESTSNLLKTGLNNKLVKQRLAGLGTASAVTYYIAPTYESYVVGIGRSATQTAQIFAQPSGNAANVTNDASESFAAIVEGYCPHGMFEVLDHDQMNINDWYDVTKLKSLKLDITGGSSASGTAQIITQQLRKY